MSDRVYYQYCKSVYIRANRAEYETMLSWLKGMGCFIHYDFSVDEVLESTQYNPVGYEFFFDDPKNAVAFKLVWG